jgi:hypothetical protein
MRTRSSNAIPRVRELAGRWSTPDLEACLAYVIKSGDCRCAPGHSPDEAVNDLARAAFVRHQMDDERVTMREALRALGWRMRRFSAM